MVQLLMHANTYCTMFLKTMLTFQTWYNFFIRFWAMPPRIKDGSGLKLLDIERICTENLPVVPESCFFTTLSTQVA
jgi:hypothetical protein